MSGYRSGFVAIVGCPNVGKSTLINRLVGQKISIVSDRAQTTRNRIMGVLHGDGFQIVFLDTPGVTEARNRLGSFMQKAVSDALSEVNAALLVVDPLMGVKERDLKLLGRLAHAKAPVFALINKSDAATVDQLTAAADALRQNGAFLADVQTVSAKTGDGVEELVEGLLPTLAEGPQYFPDDMVTDQPERVVTAELIREKALLLLREEVPHGVGVAIDRMEQRPDTELTDIYATIFCERDSHKGILIGRGGAMLKSIGTEARKDIEWMLGSRVNLQLYVKVNEDWRNKLSALRELGYE